MYGKQAQSVPLSRHTQGIGISKGIKHTYIAHAHTHTIGKLSANNKHWKWYWLGGRLAGIHPPSPPRHYSPIINISSFSSSTIYATQTRQTIIPIKRDWLCKQDQPLCSLRPASSPCFYLLLAAFFSATVSPTPKFSINAIIRCPSMCSMERANFQSSPRRTFLQQ